MFAEISTTNTPGEILGIKRVERMKAIKNRELESLKLHHNDESHSLLPTLYETPVVIVVTPRCSPKKHNKRNSGSGSESNSPRPSPSPNKTNKSNKSNNTSPSDNGNSNSETNFYTPNPFELKQMKGMGLV